MDSDRESEELFSRKLSQVMDDIGVNEFMIGWRRNTHLRLETINSVTFLINNLDGTTYIFGSQSEATTTLGMKSDTDTLISNKSVHVILKRDKWQKGKRNLLVLRDEHTPPQHCYLQKMRGDVREPAVQTESPDDVLISDGRVLKANTHVLIQKYYSKDPEIIRSGPSISNTTKVDSVFACQCAELPEECKFMFHRPRPGHWPRKDIMDKARQSVVFLVPQGYSESPARKVTRKPSAFVCMIPSTSPNYPYSKWQWRFSTSLMERYLMFDLTVEQVKAYTLAKVIRKSVFKPLYGDRFSTFHIKTAMMYTVENYPPTIWREDNIVQCETTSASRSTESTRSPTRVHKGDTRWPHRHSPQHAGPLL
ncbi:uncharacterized protein LOC128207305 [Mya arenaria]|uniref:uncharacterized protein LOC128207305 n=1 Tax=Mya arenaria TaxID=6604 RepID=UPI0022E30D6D|nr:uncharacterized protein LOC128207305 [Mya arenaria]